MTEAACISKATKATDGPHSAASVVPMPVGNDLPSLSINHCANLFGWREDLPELADYLRRVGEGEKTTRASTDLHDLREE